MRDLLQRLSRFERRYFPRWRALYKDLVAKGQHPHTLFIGCSDSRVVPYLLTGSGPGELFMVRNVGNFVPPWDASHGYHGTVAAIEFAVHRLHVRDIVVCGHSHCGAVRALYEPLPEGAPHMARWLDLARDAVLPGTPDADAFLQTEQRSVVLQLERLLAYPMVVERVARGELFLHGWHYLIDEGRVLVLDIESGAFVPVGPGEADDAAAHQLQ